MLYFQRSLEVVPRPTAAKCSLIPSLSLLRPHAFQTTAFLLHLSWRFLLPSLSIPETLIFDIGRNRTPSTLLIWSGLVPEIVGPVSNHASTVSCANNLEVVVATAER